MKKYFDYLFISYLFIITIFICIYLKQKLNIYYKNTIYKYKTFIESSIIKIE